MTLLDVLFKLLIVLLLVGLNGLFVAAEFAIVTVRKTRIEQLVEEGNAVARVVQRAVKHPDMYIAATQLGITMASLGLGWVGEPTIAQMVEPPLQSLIGGFAPAASHAIAIAISFALITSLHIVLGELAPKSLALQNPERVAMIVTTPTDLFLRVFRPFIIALNTAGNVVVRALGARPAEGHTLVYSVDELKMLVSQSREAGVIEEQEQEIIDRVFEFGETTAREVMVPRTEVIGIEAGTTIDDFLRFAVAQNHSRFPVFERDLDQIIGVAYLRDAIQSVLAGDSQTRGVESISREALVLPETVRVDVLLSEMKRRRIQLVILADEYGGTAGIVTLEDVMESIVGEVQDEFETVTSDIMPQPDGSAIVNGLVLIDQVNERFGLGLPTDDYDTIGGYVFGQIGRKPERGDVVDVEGARLRVVDLDGLRIAAIQVIPQRQGHQSVAI